MSDENIIRIENRLSELEYRFNTHKHTGADLTKKVENKHNIPIRLVASGTNTAVAATVAGDFVFPFSGYITDIAATVDTAGVTNTTTIDVLKNGASIMGTKITIDSSEKTSRTAATQYAIKVFSFSLGDILTFNIDAISTTPAKGTTIYLQVIES